MKFFIVMLLGVVLFPNFVMAADEWGKEIEGTGVSISENHAYITFKTNTELSCQYDRVVYWDISTEQGKAVYSTALMAKASNKKVRVIYSLPSPGERCLLDHLYVFD